MGPEHTGIDDFLHALMRRGEAQVVDGHDLDARFLSRGDRCVCLLGGAGERLFDHAVFARFGGADDVFTVKLGFRGNANGIDVIAGEQLIQIGDEFDAEVIGRGLSALGVGVPDCDEIDTVVFLRGVADAVRVTEPKGELGESDVWHNCSLSLSGHYPDLLERRHVHEGGMR